MPVITIVALPDADELVWDLSSEKKPHLTLLMINDPEGTEEVNILEFVQHAANTSLSRFGLSVDRRGTLGPKDADVLFFDTDYGVPELRKFRAQLLQNDHIYKNYVKEDQFPGWIPHLTLGYPDAPAKAVPDGKEYGLKWINFDRIAVWVDDFEGPEFDLRKHNMAMVEDAFWSEPHGAYLMHYGKKGMRVAVRPEHLEHAGIKKQFTEASVKRDGEGQFSSKPAATTGPSDEDMDAERDRAKSFKSVKDLIKYYDEHPEQDAIRLAAIVREKKRNDESKARVAAAQRKVGIGQLKQSALDSIDEFIAHDILGMTDEEYLEHYGRLGMRWGVRRQVGSDGRVVGSVPPRSSSAEEALAKVKRGGKMSADHKALVKNLEKKVEDLSTDEIRQITKRIEAVQKFNAVTAAQKAAKRNILSKTVRWATGAATKGAQEFGEQYIKNLVKTNLKGVVPEPQDLFKKKDKTPQPNEPTKPTPVESTVDNSPKPSKQLALEDLATVLARVDKEED